MTDAAPTPLSIDAAADAISQPWRPVVIAAADDAVVRLARFDGEFPWHRHREDELFICWRGSFRIEFAGGAAVDLRHGDVYVVPRGVEHRPVADSPAYGLMIEKAETRQYGD